MSRRDAFVFLHDASHQEDVLIDKSTKILLAHFFCLAIKLVLYVFSINLITAF